jgi:hypothetical protein
VSQARHPITLESRIKDRRSRNGDRRSRIDFRLIPETELVFSHTPGGAPPPTLAIFAQSRLVRSHCRQIEMAPRPTPPAEKGLGGEGLHAQEPIKIGVFATLTTLPAIWPRGPSPLPPASIKTWRNGETANRRLRTRRFAGSPFRRFAVPGGPLANGRSNGSALKNPLKYRHFHRCGSSVGPVERL